MTRVTALKIYPVVIWKRPRADDDSLQWLLDSYEELRSFVKRAAEAGDGLVIHIS
jgi:hypothetical protein